MRRSLTSLLAAAATVALIGCGESSVGPREAPRMQAPIGTRMDVDLSAWSQSLTWSQTQDITLTPAGGDFDVGHGLFTLHFPANSVCDPSTSDYGDGTWDAPCSPIPGNITIHATYGFYGHHIYADFSPALRFVPTDDPAGWVTFGTRLYTPILIANASYFASNPGALRYLGILYNPSVGSVVNDVNDPTLATHFDLNTGLIWRRVKHFSGYNIVTGLECTPSPDDPNCIDTSGTSTVTSGQ